MADRLYLSYWIRGFTEHNMLRHFELMLRKFPFSRLAPQLSLRVYAIELAEPPVVERDFPDVNLDLLLATAREHLNSDCAYQVDTAWDIWQYNGDWKLRPSRVSLSCFGPLFPSELGEQLLVEFGHDLHFLPQPSLNTSIQTTRHNIQGLLHLVNDLDTALAVERRKLWSESGENFAERLEAALAGDF
jgi:hypothetical protein